MINTGSRSFTQPKYSKKLEHSRLSLMQPSLLFIVASPRSGTTKLASVLNKHSQIAAATETHFFNHVSSLPCFNKQSQLTLKTQNMASFFADPRIEDFMHASSLSHLELSAALLAAAGSEESLSKKQVFDVMVSEFLRKKSKKIFCEKSPQHLKHINEISLLYPDAKFIYMLRDGRDTVSSMLKMPWRSPSLIENIESWLRYIKLGEAAQRHFPSDRLLSLRYEDLLLEPEKSLRLVCDFIGVEYEDSLLSDSNSESIFANWEADWKHKASQEIDPSRIGVWREELDPDAAAIVNNLLGSSLERLGYRLSGESRHKLKAKHYLFICLEYCLIFLQRLLGFISFQKLR